MKSKERDKIPLPKNPYSIYRAGETNKVPFPKYIAKILGMDQGELREKYKVNIQVDLKDKKVEFELVEKN